ncbi:GNAT family N-acetyltransferase [Kineosporia rhizophila]|uniref:GNAT family N-acetyltransferase n=1 Tax=Kineosporia TaxID=49184 RepID=UPI001E476D8A|nr:MULTISPECIES: GNAT family N-acetyltransferase [Kineosporia]MCE0536174.1 GNAT family N-acetyltransferase [Kineosporia rhizophila]GLY15252.1 N-acetyltransferase [Kineosporia sp. NBRC 101677]
MVLVRAATADDVAPVADLFARAFEHDPLWAALMPRAERRARNIRWLMLADLSGAGVNALDVAVDETSGLLVGALRFTTPRPDRPASWWRRTAGSAAARLGGTIGRGLRQERAVREHRPAEPHWFVQDVAADPRRQGRGIGSALLAHRLNLIDQSPAPTALEATTSGSARLYARHGFATVGTVRLLPGTESQVMIRPAT